MPSNLILPLKVAIVDLQEHQAILTFLDHMLREAAEEPLDLEADAIIRAYFKRNPEAAYRITRLAMMTGTLRVTVLPNAVSRRRRWLPLFRERS